MPDAPDLPAVPLSKAQVFFRRLLSFVALWALVLAALFSGRAVVSDAVVLGAAVLLVALGLREFYDLVARRGLACFRRWGVLGGVLLVVGTFLHLHGWLGIANSPARVNDFETMFLIGFVLGLCLLQFCSPGNRDGILAVSTTLFGLLYVAWLLNFLQKIIYFPGLGGRGKYYLLYFILVTKFSDLGAYVTGSLVGRHKLIPRISPNKTWEGLGGAILFSVLASVGFAGLARGVLVGMHWGHALVLGLVLGGGAVVGDLIESLFKREAGVKDSGRLFPGIGGILDLLDSLLFNAPLMYLYLRHVLTR
jgi:phosphatidate cytidylyltransferase